MAANAQPDTPGRPDRQAVWAVLHRNLLRAVAARKADCSAYYAPNLIHGTTVPDLERCLAAAGRKPADFRAHLCLFDRTLGRLAGAVPWVKTAAGAEPVVGSTAVTPPPGSADPAVRSAALPDNRTSLHSSDKAQPASPRPDAPPSTPLPVDRHSPRALKLVRALALLAWRPLLLLHTQAIWEWHAVCYRLYELIEWRRRHGPLTPQRITQFQEDVGEALANPLWQEKKLKTLQTRWQRLWRALFDPAGWAEWLKKRAVSPGSRFARTWMHRLDELPPEVLANPGRSPAQTQKALERRQRPVAVKDPKEWKPSTRPRRPRRRASAARVAHDATGDSPERSGPPGRPRAPDRPQAASRLAYDESLSDRYDLRRHRPPDRVVRRLEKRGRVKIPQTFEEFQKLVQEALGPEGPAPRSRRRQAACLAPEGAAPASEPAVSPGVAGVADALWDRLCDGLERHDQIASLLAASLAWDMRRLWPLWKELLPVEYAFDCLDAWRARSAAFTRARRTRQAARAPHPTPTAPPADTPGEAKPAGSAAEESRSSEPIGPEDRGAVAEEVRFVTAIWFNALRSTLGAAARTEQKFDVALYELAVERFGIHYQFLEWRPPLSPNQWSERKQRPEWQPGVTTVDGARWVKLEDGRIVKGRQ